MSSKICLITLIAVFVMASLPVAATAGVIQGPRPSDSFAAGSPWGGPVILGEDDDAPSTTGEDDDAPSTTGEDDDAPSTTAWNAGQRPGLRNGPVLSGREPVRVGSPAPERLDWLRQLGAIRGGSWLSVLRVKFSFTRD